MLPGHRKVLAYLCRPDSQLVQPHLVLASAALVKRPRPEFVSSLMSNFQSLVGFKRTSQAEYLCRNWIFSCRLIDDMVCFELRE
jgi:hypothetical protein